MLRKVLTFLTILLIAFLVYFSYKLLKEKEVAVNSLMDAVPVDASLIVEINRPELLYDLIYSPPIDAESFFNIPIIRDPLEKLKSIDSLASQEKLARKALRRPHSALITGHQIGKDKMEFIYYLKLSSEDEFKSIDKVIQNNIRAKGNLSQHNYEDAKINDVSIFNRKSAGFSYVYYKGMMILSKSSILIEEVIRQTNSSASILTKAGLETVVRTAGKSSPFNIYINFDFFPNLATMFIHKKFLPELESISKFAHWVELDCNINNNAIIFNGFSSTENTTGFLSDIFKEQEPLNLTLPGLLPSGTKSFFALGITDYLKFKVNFADYQREQLPNPNFQRNLNNFKKNTGIDLENEFDAVFNQEVCFTYYPGGGNTLTNNIFTVIKTKGSDEARRFIQTVTEINPAAGDSVQAPITGLENNYYNTSSYNIPRLLFGDVFGLNKNKFCTISEDYIIFGDTLSHLVTFSKEFSEHKNLALDINYKKITDLLSEDAYCYFYLSPDAEPLYKYYLKYTSEQMLTQYKYGLSQVQAIAYQFGRNNDLFYNNAFIQFSSQPRSNITQQWQVQLDSPLNSEIYLVKNHTTGKTEITCQDKNNNLYLISGSGEIIWKRKLDSKISGEIYQVDLFANKKLQLIFNTNTHIIALDRNGKDVEGFPIKLPSKALGPMAAFDYDKTRNYRFLIPLEDKLLYCFDKKGKEVDGWKKPPVSERPGNINYFNRGGKDYITLYDGKMPHFLDRRGRVRIQPLETINIAPHSDIYGYKNKDSFQFTSSDSSGTIHMISLTGQVTKIQTGIYPRTHYYYPYDINFDNSMEHVFFYGRKLEAYTSTGARVINHVLDGDVTLRPEIISITDSSFIYSYTDTINKHIFLNDNTGEPLQGSPLSGNSGIAFSLPNNNTQSVNLYYTNNNILICISVK